MSAILDRCVRLERGSEEYPPSLERLGARAPEALTVCGSTALLRLPLLALFCSIRTPGDAIVAAYDAARALRDRATPAIGGFQSPVERECLEYLLRGSSPVVVCPARPIEGMRLPSGWQTPLTERRLLILSRNTSARRRPSRVDAELRNRMVAALADRLLILHATPGGHIHELVGEALSWKTPVLCLDLPTNRDLVVMGAIPMAPGAL